MTPEGGMPMGERVLRRNDESGRVYGERIRWAREARGWTIGQMALLLDIPPAVLARMEIDQVQPSPQMLARIAEATGMPPRWFKEPVTRHFPMGSLLFKCTHRPAPQPRCYVCGAVAVAKCDHPVGPRQTCDRDVCERHRVRVDDYWDIDFCQEHAAMAAAGG